MGWGYSAGGTVYAMALASTHYAIGPQRAPLLGGQWGQMRVGDLRVIGQLRWGWNPVRCEPSSRREFHCPRGLSRKT